MWGERIASPAPLWVVDEATDALVAVNDAAVAAFGRSREELLRMRASELEGPVEAPLASPPERRVDVTRVTLGARTYLVCTPIEETGRHELEARFREADRLWRSLVESSPDVVLIVDVDGTVCFVNRVRPPFVGREVVGAKVWEFASSDGEARIRPLLRRIAETREALRYEAPGVAPSAGEATPWFEVCVIPLTVDGVVERVLWSATDATERRAALERLGFQARLLSQVSQPVVATDGAGRITYWNEAAERLYGWTQGEVLGKEGEGLLRTRWLAPPGRDGLLATLMTRESWRGELQHTTKHGRDLVVEASIQLQRDATREVVGVIAVMNDVTARRSLEEQLRQAQKLEAVGLLAGGVAHDFNNLLAIIMGYGESSARKLPAGHPVVKDLGEVVEAARRGGDLTRKLLAFSRKQVMRATAIDVQAAVEDFTRLLLRVVGEDVELSIERGEGPVVVWADAVQLEQALLNLSTNARQAMPDGGRLTLRTGKVTIDAAFAARNAWARAGSFAEISVKDTGVGMDDATRARLFEPFFTTKEGGTGLGLATTYGIVQQHGGFVDVKTAKGAGATFTLYLPLLAASVAPAVPSRSRPVLEPRGRELVLLAEDEPALRAIIATTLRDLGYSVVATSNGEEALEEYAAHGGDFALVMLDVVMPRLDARQVYERLCAIDPRVKVLFTTGYAPEATRIGSLLDGARVQLLEKPFTESALAERVRSMIDETGG